MTEREELARADAADAILSHPLITEALGAYQKELIEAWQTSKPKDAAGREELHRMMLAQEHFKAYLSQIVVTGSLIRAMVRKPNPLQRAARAIGVR